MSPPDADEQLRQTVSELATREGCSWAGIYFVEEDTLVLGPEAGTPQPGRRTTVPVMWRDTRVAELVVDGSVEPAELENVAAEIADLGDVPVPGHLILDGAAVGDDVGTVLRERPGDVLEQAWPVPGVDGDLDPEALAAPSLPLDRREPLGVAA